MKSMSERKKKVGGLKDWQKMEFRMDWKSNNSVTGMRLQTIQKGIYSLQTTGFLMLRNFGLQEDSNVASA